MSPADDYVRDFVKKVNRSHVLHANSVMTDQSQKRALLILRLMKWIQLISLVRDA